MHEFIANMDINKLLKSANAVSLMLSLSGWVGIVVNSRE